MAAENGTAKVGPIDVEMAGHETAPDSPNAYKDLRELFRTQSFKVLRRRDSELQSLPKKVRRFHETQNEYLEELDEMSTLFGGNESGSSMNKDASPTDKPIFEQETTKRQKKLSSLVVRISFVANICLLGMKLFATIATGSLVILSSFLDSLLDLVSGIILFAAATLARRRSPFYPVGLRRMEPLGVVIFSAVMGMSAVWIIIESARRVIDVLSIASFNTSDAAGASEGDMDEDNVVIMDPASLALLGAVIVVKVGLWIACRRVQSPAAQAYADDHRNDVLTNTFSLISSIIIFFVPNLWWVDPLSATVMALYILVNWTKTAHEHIVTLVGKSAPPEVLRQLTTLILASEADVSAINTVRAFHFGENYILEVHVVLPADMPLREAHDIGQRLQVQLEALDPIDRAYVHLDCDIGDRVDHKVL